MQLRKLALLAAFLALPLAAQTPVRQSISGFLTSSSLDQAANAAFQGCLPTDTGCTMAVVFCYSVKGSTAAPNCAVLPPGDYVSMFALERSGGTEVPNGALKIVAYNNFSVAQK